MKFSFIVLGLLVVAYAHWPWTARLAAQAHAQYLQPGWFVSLRAPFGPGP